MSRADGIVLRVDALQLQRGNRVVLGGVSLEVSRGELVAIMGPSGSGKTTILRAVAGLERFQAGRIDVDGVTLAGGAELTKPTLRALRRKVGMVFQFHCLFEHLSGIECPRAGARARHLPGGGASGPELLGVRLDHRATAPPRQLSGEA